MTFDPVLKKERAFSPSMMRFYLEATYEPVRRPCHGSLDARRQPRGADWSKAARVLDVRWQRAEKHTPLEVQLSLDNYMSYACLADDDVLVEQALSVYEERTGRQGVKSLTGIRSMRQFGYAFCLNRTGRQTFPAERLWKAGRGMLRSQLQDYLLAQGQQTLAAIWLRIVHGLHDRTLTPLQTLLLAYEDMPDVIRQE